MTDLIWNIKLRLNSMLKELQWYIKLYQHSMEGVKEFIVLFPKMFSIYFLALTMDSFKTMAFLKSIMKKKIILIPLAIMFLIFFYYLYLISGKPDRKLFEEKFFPKFYYDTAIEIRDQEGRLAGSIAQPQTFNKNPSLFLKETPKLFWSLLKERYDPYLNFENNATSFGEALAYSPPYLNGVNTLTPLVESKNLIKRAIFKQDFSVKITPTLTQQLINDFVNKHLEKKVKNQERLKLCATFYHELKANNGADFKRWLLSEHAFFYSEGRGYGLRDTAEIFFGKKVSALSSIEQVILLAMYQHPFQIDSSTNAQKRQWQTIKEEAKKIVEESEIINNPIHLTRQIAKLAQPKIPYFPDELMEVVGKITAQNQELFSTLPNRSHALLGNTKEVISQELNGFFRRYGISHHNSLVTKVNINFYLNQNFYLNRHFSSLIQDSALKNVWLSIVDEEGKFVEIFQHNTSYKNPPALGNLSKIFTALLFADRGDKYYTQYCNKAVAQAPELGGTQKCPSYAWVDARRLFSSDKLLPLFDGFTKYKTSNRQKEKVHYQPIYLKQLEALYVNLNLQMLENNEPKEELGLGKMQMSPLDFQVALHKITQLLYQANRANFYDAKLINSIEYHAIKEHHIESNSRRLSLNSPSAVSPVFKAFFTKEKRIQLQTIFKSPIYKSYGSLSWLKNYINVKFLFAQESHKEGVHWLVGAFKKKGHVYSFVLHTEAKNLSKYQAQKELRKLLEASIKALNKPEVMRNNYMKMLYRD